MKQNANDVGDMSIYIFAAYYSQQIQTSLYSARADIQLINRNRLIRIIKLRNKLVIEEV